MLTQSQYTNVVFTASRANAALVQTLRAKEALGAFPDWRKSTIQGLKIKSGFWSLSIGDYVSEAAVDIYNQLLDIGSTWAGGIVFDPNAQVSGITITGGTTTGAITITRTEAQLVDAGGGNWYLPFLDDSNNPFPTTAVPVFIEINGVQLNGYTLDSSTSPARIYGFPNNDPQTIVVTILGATGSAPPPPQQAINWSWFATGPYATINTQTFLFSGTIVPNVSSYTLPFGSSATGNYLAVAELATNPVKTTWLNTILNYGTFPDSVFHAPIVIGSIRYYVSRVPVTLQSGQTNLTLSV